MSFDALYSYVSIKCTYILRTMLICNVCNEIHSVIHDEHGTFSTYLEVIHSGAHIVIMQMPINYETTMPTEI